MMHALRTTNTNLHLSEIAPEIQMEHVLTLLFGLPKDSILRICLKENGIVLPTTIAMLSDVDINNMRFTDISNPQPLSIGH